MKKEFADFSSQMSIRINEYFNQINTLNEKLAISESVIVKQNDEIIRINDELKIKNKENQKLLIDIKNKDLNIEELKLEIERLNNELNVQKSLCVHLTDDLQKHKDIIIYINKISADNLANKNNA